MLKFNILLLFVSSSSIGRRYPRRRGLLCFLLFIILVASTAGLVVRVVVYDKTFFQNIFGLVFSVFNFICCVYLLLCCMCSGGHMEASYGLQRDLRCMGAADGARSVHHCTNYLLELSENQQSHIQHHIDRKREKVMGGRGERKVRGLGDEEEGDIMGIEETERNGRCT